MRYLFILALLAGFSGCNSETNNIALGTLERERIALTATSNEIIIALPIRQGTQVTQGTVLVQLDDSQQQIQVLHAQAKVMQAQANLDKLEKGAREEEIAAARAQVAGSKATLLASDANYSRVKNMASNKLTSQSELDRALATRDSERANLHSVEEQLRTLITGTRPEDIRIAQANLAAVTAALASENKKLADLTITATRAGILDNLPWNLGERVTVGSPVAVVLAGAAPYARVYIPQPYRVSIRIGDELEVQVDGLDENFTGKVRWIANEPAFSPYYALNQQERARLMYLAEVQLTDNAIDLPNGIPVEVLLP